MQRHFSNRGEALAEVTAARMLARRKQPAESAFPLQGRRQAEPAQWFMKPTKVRQRGMPKQPKHQDVIPLL